MKAFLAAALTIGLSTLAGWPPAVPSLAAQSDLDAFMQQVLARRDDNWKKLQQYVLDEREEMELRGPERTVLWGERREYTWFIRDGHFVRSPLRFNGVTIGEADRRKYEAEFLRREQEREKRQQEQAADHAPAAPGPEAPPDDVNALLAQSRQPQFISSAYFLRFKFESGKYALVGREALDGRDTLRIEYYPTVLFNDERAGVSRQNREQRRDRDEPLQAEAQRLLNKAALVTLWIDPGSHQILKYTFDNVGSALSALSLRANSLPLDWLAHVDGLSASMTMGQPFPDVWLPRALEMRVGVSVAVGAFDLRYALDYHDYRRADVSSTIRVPDVR
jgi:hypothetical protein